LSHLYQGGVECLFHKSGTCLLSFDFHLPPEKEKGKTEIEVRENTRIKMKAKKLPKNKLSPASICKIVLPLVLPNEDHEEQN